MKGGLCEIKAGYCVKREWCIVGNVSGVFMAYASGVL